MAKSKADLCKELEESCERLRKVNKIAAENRIRQDLAEPMVERTQAANTVYSGSPASQPNRPDVT